MEKKLTKQKKNSKALKGYLTKINSDDESLFANTDKEDNNNDNKPVTLPTLFYITVSDQKKESKNEQSSDSEPLTFWG